MIDAAVSGWAPNLLFPWTHGRALAGLDRHLRPVPGVGCRADRAAPAAARAGRINRHPRAGGVTTRDRGGSRVPAARQRRIGTRRRVDPHRLRRADHGRARGLDCLRFRSRPLPDLLLVLARRDRPRRSRGRCRSSIRLPRGERRRESGGGGRVSGVGSDTVGCRVGRALDRFRRRRVRSCRAFRPVGSASRLPRNRRAPGHRALRAVQRHAVTAQRSDRRAFGGRGFPADSRPAGGSAAGDAARRHLGGDARPARLCGGAEERRDRAVDLAIRLEPARLARRGPIAVCDDPTGNVDRGHRAQ